MDPFLGMAYDAEYGVWALLGGGWVGQGLGLGDWVVHEIKLGSQALELVSFS